MKKPVLFALGLVAVTLAACGGKVVVESSGATGAGGAGGTPSSFTTADGAPDPSTNVAVVAVGATSAGVTTGTGTGACDPTYTCAEAVTPPNGDPSKLCEGPSAQLFDALSQCVCVDSCAIECGANTCAGMTTSAACNACITDQANGCGKQFNACANDI